MKNENLNLSEDELLEKLGELLPYFEHLRDLATKREDYRWRNGLTVFKWMDTEQNAYSSICYDIKHVSKVLKMAKKRGASNVEWD